MKIELNLGHTNETATKPTLDRSNNSFPRKAKSQSVLGWFWVGFGGVTQVLQFHLFKKKTAVYRLISERGFIINATQFFVHLLHGFTHIH